MAIQNLYKSTVPSIKYIFANGKEAPFVGGKFHTSVPSEVAELDQEVLLGHPFIYVDKDQLTVDSANLDPLADIKAKAIADFLAAQKLANDPNNNRGTTTFSGKLGGIANSGTIADAAANSLSPATAVK